MLNHALVIALSVYGFSALFWQGMIFQRIGDKLEDRLPDYITKPLFGCVICMVPWYGLPMYGLLCGMEWKIIPVLLVAMGINAFLSHLTGLLEDIANGASGID